MRMKLERGSQRSELEIVRALRASVRDVGHRLRETAVRMRAPQKVELEDDWFITEQRTERGIRSMLEYINTHHTRETRLAFAAVATLAAGCAFEYGQHENNDAQDHGTETTVVDFTPNMEEYGIDIQFRVEKNDGEVAVVDAVRIRDANVPETWDRPLAQPYAVDEIENNELYQYHRLILREHVHGRIAEQNLAPIVDEYQMSEGSSIALKQHIVEEARMPAGTYPVLEAQLALFSASEVTLGNMEVEHPEAFTETVLDHAQTYATEQGWGDDMDQLSAAQWVEIIDQFNADQPYDFTLASTHETYDPTEASTVNAMPVDRLVERSEGAVCRDFLREQFAAYGVYNEQFDLEQRGLLMIPLVRFADAGHARSLFVIAHPERDISVVVTDTTNTRFNDPRAHQDSTADAAAIWYGQSIASKEWFSHAVARDFFSLSVHADGLFPTTQAVAQREIVISSLALAEHALRQEDRRTYKQEVSSAYADLFTKLDMQAEHNGVLSTPGQMIPLFDLCVALGARIDAAHEQQALNSFVRYVEDRGLTREDLQMYRSSMEQINRVPLVHPEHGKVSADIHSLRVRLGL